MNVLARQVKRRRDQPQNPGKYESGDFLRLPRWSQAHDEDERGKLVVGSSREPCR